MNVNNWSIEWGGRTLSVEMGKLALLSQASCTVRYGDTVILATAVMSSTTRDGIDFFPLTVNFEEKLYAAGKIKGSRFIKREGKASEEAILWGRLIDRAIRPLFSEDIRNDVQVILTALSFDKENDSQIPAMIAASIVLSTSPIPWNGPIAGLRVGRNNGKWMINPTFKDRENSDADIVIAGTPDKIIMVEAGCNEIPEKEVIEAMQFGAKNLAPVLDFIKKIQSEVGQAKVNPLDNPSEQSLILKEAEEEVKNFIASHVDDWIFDTPKKSRSERVEMTNKFNRAIVDLLKQRGIDEMIIKNVLSRVKLYIEKHITERILDKEQRLDGRSLTEVRELYNEVGLLPRTHGSGLFMRGDTQVLSIVTLGSPGDVQTMDTMEEDGTKRYMHHYNDTPASYGECGMLRGPGNRAIGHGALAERALISVLPDEKDFPYAIRVVSEVLGSNGSSSMASTCGSTLALLDAGVPIKKSVAGIAIGLASDKKGRWKLITDLQDVEDGPGGMDFKITGSREGITAMQMDTKTDGLNWELIKETFKCSREARLQILDAMEKVIAEPRKEMSQFAPRIVTVHIDPDKIRDVIGPGGKIINKIIEETGAKIDIEQTGRVLVTSENATGLQKALDRIKELTHEVTAGEIYEGTVVRLEDFGAFVNILPGKDGLVHVSEIAWKRTDKPSDVLNIGDKVRVIVREIDNLGRVNLSIRALLDKPTGYTEQPPRERSFGGGGGRGGAHRGSGGGGFRRGR